MTDSDRILEAFVKMMLPPQDPDDVPEVLEVGEEYMDIINELAKRGRERKKEWMRNPSFKRTSFPDPTFAKASFNQSSTHKRKRDE